MTTLPRDTILHHYWGKADPNYVGEPKWHPLAYHSLDVAAVAACWWDENPALRERFRLAFASADADMKHLRAWVLFFVALHDLGKFDVRFQLKAIEALTAAWKTLEQRRDHEIPRDEISRFDHGRAGMQWAHKEFVTWVTIDPQIIWARWSNWLAAVTGHHGDYCETGGSRIDTVEADDSLIEHDRHARHAWVSALESLFLAPAGLTLNSLPPVCALPARALLAGFCASSDWLGSNTDVFGYCAPGAALNAYFDEHVARIRRERLLENFGLLATPRAYPGLQALLSKNESPRGVQTEIDTLSAVPGLTLIEAPTGSGKTEAALAYAWRLLAAGAADSIVFALPTQATANAMLARIERFGALTFVASNVVLAHGKRQFNAHFQQFVERGQRLTAQGKEEAAVQCAAWLANSRKRVFLGQIGVCTVDQVLLSVLPVRHKFVRGFGLAKSVLIVDEVHAYDAYMHGLLGEVLKAQRACGGSAILLSATLASGQRDKLLAAWESHSADTPAPYPVLWHATGGEVLPKTVAEAHRPPRREVGIECLCLANAYPDEALFTRIVAAAESGALVGIVVNLVDDAQRLARTLRQRTSLAVDIFHARYRFADRQGKEHAVLAHYGREAPRGQGRILVATQVIEQSLDLDFDWLLTQICPVDLLFQRLGRLHRHARDQRPPGFETPRCTVLTVEGDDYGMFKLIYGNARVLWRTQTLLTQTNVKLVFPEAYREWIERVYQRDDWDGEPDNIATEYDVFSSEQCRRAKEAKRLTTIPVAQFKDEGQITGLTRDGEMSLSVLPVTADGALLDGQRIDAIPERNLGEAINLNTVPAPASWKNSLRNCPMETEGALAGAWQLVVVELSAGIWQSKDGKFTYSQDFGLEKCRHEPA